MTDSSIYDPSNGNPIEMPLPLEDVSPALTLIPKKKKRNYTSPSKRDPKAFACQITDRDLEIFRAINKHAYLSVGLINKLAFPKNSTKQSCQRRLKVLWHNGYIQRITPYIKVNQGSTSCVYIIDKKGIELLIREGVEVKKHAGSRQSQIHLFHAIDVSAFAINVEIALKNLPSSLPLKIHRMVFDFEVKSEIDSAIGHTKYKLYSEFEHPVSKQTYKCYPDLILILRGKEGSAYEKVRKLICVEIDRGTMGMKALVDKLIGYDLYFQNGVFKKWGNFNNFSVWFQASSERRVQNIRKAFTGIDGEHRVLVTDLEKVEKGNMFTDEIWLNSEWKTISILKTS